MKVNKEFVLSKITEEQIFEFYLNINVNTHDFYYSPFQKEEVPSCRFYRSKGKLRFNDFGRKLNVDCFELVGILYSIDCNTKQGFLEILNIIASDFNLIQIKKSRPRLLNRKEKFELKSETDLKFAICEFNEFDYKFWEALNISRELLKKSRYYRISSLFFKGKKLYRYEVFKFAFVSYEYVEDGNLIYQIYLPFKEKRYRYLHNKSVVRLLDFLEDTEFCIITKSRKDALVLISLGISSISVGSETTYITEETDKYIKSKSKLVFTLFDYDGAGRRAASYHVKTYGYIPLFLKPTKLNFSGKDISDYILEKGKEATQELINKFKIKILPKWQK